MKRYMYPFLLALIATPHIQAQTKVTSGVMHGKDYGVTYMLPQTELILEVEETHYEYTPGEFSVYAEKYLHIPNVSQQKEDYWKINRVKLYAIGVPDKEKVYFVKMKDKSVAPLMQISKEGIIKAINVPTPIEENQEKGLVADNKAPEALNAYNYLTEEILSASSKAKMAELTAKEIYSIQESRNALLKGEADNMPKDGMQLKLMLEQLQKQENALKQLFVGKTEKESKVIKLTITPKEMSKQIIARFSSRKGLIDADDMLGTPIYLSIEKLNVPNMVQDDADNKKKVKSEGVAYNLPGRAKITLEYQHQPLVNSELAITQFGGVEYLTPVLFDKKSIIQITFNPTTGAILQVNKGEKE